MSDVVGEHVKECEGAVAEVDPAVEGADAVEAENQ